MQQVRLGSSGLRVSRIALGCMSYGDPARGLHDWTLDEEASQPFFRQAVELGVTFWDTANAYQQGTSEEFVGRAVRRYSRREEVVIATKVFGTMHPGPGGSGLSRGAVLEQVDASLRRLGTDYIDLYLIHRFDPDVPVEETMEALHDVVRAGKVRYLGASSMWAWQFAKLQHAAALHGWTPFVAMQDQYNLVKREEEREMLPMCLDSGVGAMPYSPLAKGRLTRPWGQQTARSARDAVAKSFDRDEDQQVVDAVEAVARERGVPMAHVALAWVLGKPVVAAPVVGATRPAHLADAVAALEVHLTDDEVAALEAPYVPQEPYWW
jgi:aryl-alcohol dehydrogenase-like predicted oxidoreductase